MEAAGKEEVAGCVDAGEDEEQWRRGRRHGRRGRGEATRRRTPWRARARRRPPCTRRRTRGGAAVDVEGAVGQPDGGSEGDGDGEGAAAQQPGGVSGRSGGGGL